MCRIFFRHNKRAQGSKTCIVKESKEHTNPMFQLQILFNKKGEWENTVFLPMDKMKALDVMAMHNKLWSKDHCYRIIEVA